MFFALGQGFFYKHRYGKLLLKYLFALQTSSGWMRKFYLVMFFQGAANHAKLEKYK